MSKGVRLISVSASGFRGYAHSHTIRFDRPVTVLTGPNMAGKSSTLGAVEWALFSDFLSLQKPRDKRDAEIVNDLSRTAEVTLVLEVDSKELTVKRSRKKHSAKSDFIITEGEQVFRGHEAEERLFRLLQMTAEDFQRGAFLHQESPAGLLRDSEQVRD